MLWILISLGVLALLFQASWGVPLFLAALGWIVISTVVSYYLARLAIGRDGDGDADGDGHNDKPGGEI